MIKWLTGWKGYVVAAVAGALASGYVQGLRWDAEVAGIKSDHSEYIEKQATASLEAVERARAQERQRTAIVEAARNEAQEQARIASGDADNARLERDRLRKHADALARAAASRDTAAANGSPPGAAGADLLAYMLGRVSDRATKLAEVADSARIRGLACEAAYFGMSK